MEQDAPADFPLDRVAPPLSEALARGGIALHGASACDLPFLRTLYLASRMPELLGLPWTAAERCAFAEQQFRLQHRHLLRHYGLADFWIVTRNGAAVGRLYIERGATEWRLIDVLLSPDSRAQGIGSALIRWVQTCAREAGACGVALHVAINNPRAHALYRRLGFVDVEGGDGLNLPMRWNAAIRP